ncbi:MAG: putative salt-induced outer membrane protein [Gammaproteobacteria bacterium]|jgi:putative salt-induced outer membrane protein
MSKYSAIFAYSAISVFGSSISAAINADEVEKSKIWSGDVEFGYVSITGNSEETSIKARTDINRERDIWLYNIHLESLNTKSDDNRSAEKYFLSNRLGREFTKTDYAFAYASYDEDHFSGFDYQATTAIGWGHRLVDKEHMQWDVEAGPGYRISKVDEGNNSDDSDEAIIRLFTKFDWTVSDTSSFSQSINVESGSDNTITKSDSALKVKIIGALALKLFYTIKYTEEVPMGTKHADTEMGVTLNYGF